MKKYISFLSVVALALAVTMPKVISAQTLIDTTAAGSISASIDAQTTGIKQTSVLNKIRADLGNRNQNLKTNEEIRKIQLDNHTASSSSRVMPPLQKTSTTAKTLEEERRAIASTSRDMIKNVRIEDRNDIRIATSSQARQEIRREMRRDIFNIEKQKVIQQLGLSIQNLKQVRDRVDSRIKKEQQNGRNMNEAIKLLVIADMKIIAAQNALQALRDYTPKSLTASSTSTSTIGNNATASINLDSARQMIKTVREEIKIAHKSLTDTVVAIAHSMGIKSGEQEKTSHSPTPTITPAISPSISPAVSPSISPSATN